MRTDVPLPIPVSGTVSVKDLAPTPAELMLAAGSVAFSSPVDAHKAFPDLFPSAEAARKGLDRSGSTTGHLPVSTLLTGECPPVLVPVTYQPAGERLKPRKALVTPERLVGLVEWLTNCLGVPVRLAVQRVHLTPDGRKAEAGKITNGYMAGAAVRLPGDPTGPLLVAEGPETGLSVWSATGYETWVALGGIANLMPPRSRQIVACRDDDNEHSPSDNRLRGAVRTWACRAAMWSRGAVDQAARTLQSVAVTPLADGPAGDAPSRGDGAERPARLKAVDHQHSTWRVVRAFSWTSIRGSGLWVGGLATTASQPSPGGTTGQPP